jgi:hypothetical protein
MASGGKRNHAVSTVEIDRTLLRAKAIQTVIAVPHSKIAAARSAIETNIPLQLTLAYRTQIERRSISIGEAVAAVHHALI